jgi:iron complex outermembrane receptor protein
MASIGKQGHPLLASLLTVSLAALTPVEAFAEEPPEEQKKALVEELELLKEETISIAVRHEQPISQAPSDVYVISDEDIRQSGATDIPTILRRVPGMEVMQMSGADYNVSVRGDNQIRANKLLVMVDGRSIYIDAQGNVYWKNIPVTLPEIKRIEVLKGPASAIYGFNAFDGVVNIITKSPEEMRGTTLQFGGGEFGTISSAAIHGGTVGKFGYRLSVGHDQNQQWRNRNALAFRNNKFNVQTEYALPGDSRISLSGGLVDANRFDGDVSEVAMPATQPSQGYTSLAYERPDGFLRAWWTGNYHTTDVITDPLLAPFLQITDLNGSSRFSTTTNTYNIEAQHSLQLGSTNRLTYGINYRYNALSSTFTTGSDRENRLGIYLHDDWKITDAWSVAAGVRYDLDTFIHGQFSPRIALFYRPAPDHTFRVGLSVAYRPPTLAETYLDILNVVTIANPVPPPPFFQITFPTLGSSNLNPEEIVSYNASYQGWFLQHRLRLRTELFFNHISNLISFLPSGPAPSDPVIAANGGVADIYGGEAGFEYLVTSWLSGFVNAAYEKIGQTFTGTTRRGAPRWKVNAGLRGEWDNGLSAEALLHYVDAATYPIGSAFANFAPAFPPGSTVPTDHVGSYTLLNLRGAYRFWQQKAAAGYMREAEVAVSAFNALNDKHKEHPLGDTIGSRVMGWVTLKF